MEITNNRKENAVMVTADDPRCVAISTRYGNAQGLYLKVTNSEPMADTPNMVMCMKTFGKDTIVNQLATRLNMAMLMMDESALNDEEINIVANSIADDPNGRILTYDLVMRFFRYLELGMYELYSCKPRHIMAAWQSYCKSAHTEMNKLKEAQQHEIMEAERAKNQKEYLRPDEFRRWKEQWKQANQ